VTHRRTASRTNWLEEAVRAIRAGGVVALPFERLFGLAADALSPAAVARSARSKDRPADRSGDRPIAVIVPDMEAVFEVASHFGTLATTLASKYWPGPLTILVPAADHVPAPLVNSGGQIGVRLPGPCPAFDLARACGRVLTATSANSARGPDALTHEDIMAMSHVEIDLIVPGSVLGPPGSTVVDATGDEPVVLRRGIIDIEEA
jgi:L-threonylcarbamoyladenylate synthase